MPLLSYLYALLSIVVYYMNPFKYPDFVVSKKKSLVKNDIHVYFGK